MKSRQEKMALVMACDFYKCGEWFGPSEISSLLNQGKSASMSLARHMVEQGKLEQRTRGDKYIEYRQKRPDINRVAWRTVSNEEIGLDFSL